MSTIAEIYDPKAIPLVSVCVITYNHGMYISEAIEGILFQQVNFNVEILIHDDASPDNTQDILRTYDKKYPGLFKLILQTENQKSKLGGGMQPTFNYPRSKGKYIAHCEGDDYWIDPQKLQRQVDFLEQNENYTLTHTDANIHVDHTSKIYTAINKIKNRTILSGDVFLEKLTTNFRIFTCTTVFRKIPNLGTIHSNHKNFRQGDLILFLELSKHGLVKYFDTPTAVYRIHKKSVTQSQSPVNQIRFKLSSLRIRMTIAKKYKIDDAIIEPLNIDYHKHQLEFAYLNNDAKLMKEVLLFLNQNGIILDRKQQYKASIVLGKGIGPKLKKVVLGMSDSKTKIINKLSDYKNKYISK